MEKVLDVYERPYDACFPVVCMYQSPKKIIDYQVETGSDGKQYQDCEYVRKGVTELFVAFEPLAGWREISVEQDHKAATCLMDNLSTHKSIFISLTQKRQSLILIE